MTLKSIQPHLKKVLQDYLNTVKNAKKSDLEKPFIPEDNADFIQAIERCFISSYLLGMIHAEEENPDRKINAADTEIPPVKFEEAVDFLKARVPMTKKEWENLEPKLRFRAFTVAKLGTAVEIETAKQILISALEKGESYSQTWEIMNDIFGKGELGFKPVYWENVFRTNTQTAYMAGKLQQYEKTPGIVAYQLMIIEDVRTSKICRRLITKAGRGLVLSVDDEFWKTKGFPPYHFQCRSSVRAVYQHQLKAENIKIDHPKHLDRFKPGEGFGGNPIHKESWWRMTKEMAIRAAQFDIFNDIEKQAKANGLYNFSMDLVNGSDLRKLQGTNYYAEKAKLADPEQKEVNLSKILTENGHTWYFTPENHISNMKNPDGIFDGKVADMKILTSTNPDKIIERILECDTQKVRVSIIHVKNISVYSEEKALEKAKEALTKSLQFVKEVVLVYGENIHYLK